MFIGNLNSIGRGIYGGSAFTNDYSLLFDGVDEYVDCGRVTATESATNLSISLWVKLPDITGDKYLIGKFGSSSQDFYLAATGSSLRIDVGNGSNIFKTRATVFAANTWYHLVVVYNGSATGDENRLKLYWQGTDITTWTGSAIPASLTSNTASWYLGAMSSSFVGNAYIDEPAIFDYSLTSGQVTSIYNSGTPTDLDNTSGVTAPVHWWRMGDGDTFSTNWTINDVGTTGGNDGTSANMEEIDRVCGVNPTGFCNDYSLVFDGVDEYVALSSTPSALVSASAFSVSVWIKAETGVSYSGGRTIFEFFTSSTNGVRLLLSKVSATRNTRVDVLNGATTYGIISATDDTPHPTVGSWENWVIVYDGGGATNADKLKLYRDGANQAFDSFNGTIPSTTSSTSTHTHQHIANIVDVYYWLGKVDEFAIFDYALTSGQVTSIYNSGAPTDLDNTSGVTAPTNWLRMGDGSDTISTINDVGTTGGMTGTPQNMESGDITNDRPI